MLVERVEGFCTEADWLRAYTEINDFEHELAKAGAIVGIPMLLVLRQPDLGTALTYVPIAVMGIFLGGMQWKQGVAVGLLAGVGLGALVTLLLGRMLQLSLHITVGYVALALAVSTLVGVASGWYPASKAARLDPVEALRAE